MANPRREAKRERTTQMRAAQLAQQRKKRQIRMFAIVAVVGLVSLGLISLTNSGSSKNCPPAAGSPQRRTTFTSAPPMCIDPAKKYTAVFDTSEGTIKVALDPKATPQTVNNFVVLARYKYYDSTPIFRTNTDIGIIQGGGQSTQDPGPGYTIADEGSTTRHYSDGDLVMARPSQPNSAGAEFFFGGSNVANLNGPPTQSNPGNGTYVTFGHVSDGLEVVHKILALDNNGAPSHTVTVNHVTITES